MVPRVLQIIAPNASLSFKPEIVARGILRSRLLGVNVCRHPRAAESVQPPAVEVKRAIGEPFRGVRSREAHNVEVLILHPDPADKATVLRILTGLHVHDSAVHLPKTFPADKFETVVLAIEMVQVRE